MNLVLWLINLKTMLFYIHTDNDTSKNKTATNEKRKREKSCMRGFSCTLFVRVCCGVVWALFIGYAYLSYPWLLFPFFQPTNQPTNQPTKLPTAWPAAVTDPQHVNLIS
jgi:hypothetical protein